MRETRQRPSGAPSPSAAPQIRSLDHCREGLHPAHLPEHGRVLCVVDALSEEWGRTPRPPAGKTIRARS
ncbi:hypothetical protein ACFT4A_37975 [Streptomyces sp. NPDC057099]|uniref:hypothetical protein n=1 Tax=Streptomyces sp. NPDC057099 TaxID=3346019 RepID=UPI00362DB445